MYKSDLLQELSDYMFEACGYQCKCHEEKILEIVEKYMIPKHGGKHQSSYDLAMGSTPEWDKE
jgi:hypothetical protein